MDGKLDLRIKRPLQPVSTDKVAALSTFCSTLSECAALSGLKDKTVAIEIGIDAALWSRMKSGDAGIKGETLDALMDACGNELPLLWLLYRRGYDPLSLRKRESEVEQENRELKEQLAKERQEREIITKFVRETRA